MNSSHRILVCGVGSVGERHIRNLVALGHINIAVYRTRNFPFRDVDVSIPIFTDLNEAITNFCPTVTFITNPTAFHVPVALEMARAKSHLFIEKPISHNLEGLDELSRILASHDRMAMVGYMLRFHPLFQQVKKWLGEGPSGRLGRPIFLRTTWGEHLPDWHPWEDYRESYAAQASLGGGPALTLSHDLDLLIWWFGAPEHVTGLSNTTSPLDLQVEHCIDMLLGFPQGVTANVHLDFCQRPPSRVWELVCSHAKIQIDVLAGTLMRWESVIGDIHAGKSGSLSPVEVQTLPETFDRNDLFLDELRYFFSCLQRGEQPMPDIPTGAESVRITQQVLSKDVT